MAYLITAALLLFGYAVAQDPDCDFRQTIGPPPARYSINKNYRAGQTCRYIADCPQGYNCRADCVIYMPSSAGCAGDRLMFSRSGDPQLNGAEAFCGYRTVSVVSTGNMLAIGLVSVANSPGGNYTCNLTAQLAPVTPPPLCRCGEKKTNRIVGGQETGVNEYTMMAALYEPAIRSIHCGGTIIAPQYIMTAAHAVDNYRNRPGDLVVIVADHYINNPNSGTWYVISSERGIIIHEQYNRNNYDNDIALVKTRDVIKFNENVQPVCLPFKYEFNDLAGTSITLLGWGTESFGGPTSDVLLKADVSVISQSQCAQTEANITARQMCTYTPGKDACQFDSGGPGLTTDPQTGLLFSTCIISSGNLCAGTRPGICTRVPQQLRWIVNNANTNFCIKR